MNQRQRVQAVGRLSSKQHTSGRGTLKGCIDTLYQQGSARIRFPKVHTGSLQAVLINTAGGLTGDDNIHWQMQAGVRSHLTVSTAACEKIYRTHGPEALQNTQLDVQQDARLNWLPQESILFNGSALKRCLTVNLAPSATAMLVESLVFGRQAMRETLKECRVHDQWRVYQNNALLHAEDFRLDTRLINNAQKTSMLHHQGAYSTLLFISPASTEWQQTMVDRVRYLAEQNTHTANTLAPHTYVGVSALPSRVIVRVLASNSFHLRRFLIPCIELFCDNESIPSVWNV